MESRVMRGASRVLCAVAVAVPLLAACGDAAEPSPDPGAPDAPPATRGLAWFSDWRTAQGATREALYDGAKWNGQLCSADVLSVVAAEGLGMPTANALRVSYTEPGACLMVQATDRWPAPEVGQYLFLRVYYRNDMPDGQNVGFPHPLHLGRSPSPAAATYATWVNFSAPSGGVSPMTMQVGDGPEWPDRFWGYGFRTGQTYRLELRVHRETESMGRVDVRVYDAAGALVADASDWTNGESGANRRTLADSNPSYPVDAGSFTLLEIGNNDPSALVAGVDRFIYFAAAAVVVSADPEAWPGPYPTAEEAAR